MLYSSRNILTLQDHYRLGVPPLVDLMDGDADLSSESGIDLTTESGATLTSEGTELPWVPSLLEVKRHLDFEDDDTEENSKLSIYRESAAVMLLAEIGQDGRVTDYMAEARYDGVPFKQIRIDRSNVQSVASVTEVDCDGTETAIPDTEYTLRWLNDIAYLEGKFNEDCDKDMVKVGYRRGFPENAPDTTLLKQVMLDTIKTLYVAPGRLTEKTLRRNPAFSAAIDILRDRRSRIKWTY